MTVLSVDADAMMHGIPQVEQLISLLNDMAGRLDGIAVPAGVPAGLAARVTSTTHVAAQSLRAKARELDGIPGDLRRRVAAAQLADASALNAAGWGLRLLGMHFHAFSIQNLNLSTSLGIAARELHDLPPGEGPSGGWKALRIRAGEIEAASGTPGVPGGLAKGAAVGGRLVTAAGWALAAYSNFRDPRLSIEQKAGRTAASIATGTGVSILAGAASGAAFGTAAGPLGTLVGFGAGAAWTVVDTKLGVSRRIGDAAADVTEKVEDVGGDVVHGAGSVAHKALGVVGL